MLAIARKLKPKLKAGDTAERCGLILKNGKIIETTNNHPQPDRGFVIPGQDLVRHEAKLLGTWHTHPTTPAVLSQEDYAGFLNWPELTHFIVGPEGVRAYRVVESLVKEVDLAAD